MVLPAEPALFLPDEDGFVGTRLIQGGWHPDQANGGAVRPSVSADHSKPGRKRIPVSIL